MRFMLPRRPVYLETTIQVSTFELINVNKYLDFDISVLVRNANVKNNYFSVVFTDQTMIASVVETETR